MNYNPKSKENLKMYQSKWNNGKTRTIRVPVALADQVLDYARQLDNNSLDTSDNSSLITAITEIVTKIDNKEKGYKSNGSGQLIKAVKALLG